MFDKLSYFVYVVIFNLPTVLGRSEQSKVKITESVLLIYSLQSTSRMRVMFPTTIFLVGWLVSIGQ